MKKIKINIVEGCDPCAAAAPMPKTPSMPNTHNQEEARMHRTTLAHLMADVKVLLDLMVAPLVSARSGLHRNKRKARSQPLLATRVGSLRCQPSQLTRRCSKLSTLLSKFVGCSPYLYSTFRNINFSRGISTSPFPFPTGISCCKNKDKNKGPGFVRMPS